MTKIKKTTQASVTLEQAEQAAQQFAKASNRLGLINAEVNQAMEKVRSKYTDEIVELQNTISPDGEIMHTLEAYAIANIDTWGGRSTDLTHAVIGFRMGTRKVDKLKGFTWEAVLALVKAHKPLAAAFIRTKEELDKKAILETDLKTLQVLEQKAKIVLVREETFYVEAHKEILG
jgi:phage host-nuclease inhibitor protein Gam